MSKPSLYDARTKLQEMIADLPADAKLPSVRQLVEQTGATHTTVFAALKSLESHGFIYSRQRRGFYRSGGHAETGAAPIGVLFRFGEFFLEQVPYVQEILAGVKQSAVHKGRHLLFLSYRKNIHSPALDVREIKAWNLSGLIVIEVEDPAVIGGLRDAAWPVVFVEANVFGYGNSVVSADDGPAIGKWCRAMHRAGTQRFLMLSPLRVEERDLYVPGAQADQRIAALQAALAGLDLPPEALHVAFVRAAEPQPDRVRERVKELLAEDGRPTAIVTFADMAETAEEAICCARPTVTSLLVWEGRRVIAGRPTFVLRHPNERIGAAAVRTLEVLQELRGDLRRAPRHVADGPDLHTIQADRHLLVTIPSDLSQLH
jgi:DNA-binding LacI/PurR family transcriptional regulator